MRRERAGWGRAGGTREDAPRSRRGAWRANHPAPGAQWDTDADERESGRRLLFKRATRANPLRISLEKNSPAQARPPVVVRVVRRSSASARLLERLLERGRAHRRARARRRARRPEERLGGRLPPARTTAPPRRRPRAAWRAAWWRSSSPPRRRSSRARPCGAGTTRACAPSSRRATATPRRPLPRGDQPREVRAHRGDVRRAQSRPRRGAIETAIRRLHRRRRRRSDLAAALLRDAAPRRPSSERPSSSRSGTR